MTKGSYQAQSTQVQEYNKINATNPVSGLELYLFYKYDVTKE